MSLSDPFLTIFTAPKPFTNPHISVIQRNAIQSWQHLGDDVLVLMIGDEAGMADFAAERDLKQLPGVSRNEQGTPLVSSIFELAHQNSTSPLLAYVNADILLTPEFVSLARQLFSQANEFIIVGQRWDLDVQQVLDFTPGWDVCLLQEVKSRGRLHPPGGSDYFIFPRNCFMEVPRFAIGRAGWDNWMFYHARLQHWPIVDVSSSLTIIHQDHDYSHLPGGQPHYQMPESFENIHLSGGRRTIFTLLDADYTFQSGKLQHLPVRGRRFWRNFETYPLIQWHSNPLAELAFALCHPVKAFGEWRGRLAYKFNTYRHLQA
jgi:hypothetical protein